MGVSVATRPTNLESNRYAINNDAFNNYRTISKRGHAMIRQDFVPR